MVAGVSPTIRRASLVDREVVLAFHRALYLDHRSALMPEGLEILYAYRRFEEVLHEDVEAMLRDRGVVVLVAEAEDEALGYATGSIRDVPRRVLHRKGVLGDWYVAPSARGLGVGRQLFDALLEHFREEGCSLVETMTWPFNTGTRAAMGRLGFQEVQVTYRMHLDEEELPPPDGD